MSHLEDTLHTIVILAVNCHEALEDQDYQTADEDAKTIWEMATAEIARLDRMRQAKPEPRQNEMQIDTGEICETHL